VSGVIVNGSNAEYEYNESFITMAASALQEGHNEVVVHFSHGWSDDDLGYFD